jgi:predicted nucleotidyltransferase
MYRYDKPGGKTMLLDSLVKKKLITPPKFLPESVAYLTIMGSEAYGVSSGDSDKDVYGFCIPPKDDVFPHLRGEILGFGRQINRFEQWQEHHIQDEKTEYDFAVFSIVKYFQLAMENNPNMLDSLYTPQRCVLHTTQIGQMVRDSRTMFLHKGCVPKLKGYAYSQLHKMDIKNPEPGSKRAEDIEKHGYDTKFAYHVVRLLLQCEQILVEHDLDLERHREQLKAIRRGEWTVEQIKDFFQSKEKHLEDLYHSSTLPYKPDEDKIKQLLLSCLEQYYGTLKNAIVIPNQFESLKKDMQELLDKYSSE